jgi:Na+-translocating ferredoxin:NAD+ oxidoreductase RnfD subunit
MSRLLTVSPSPHIAGNQSVNQLMYGVIISLVPAFLVSAFIFGPVPDSYGLWQCCPVSFTNRHTKNIFLNRKLRKGRFGIGDRLLLAFNLPSKPAMVDELSGSVFAIVSVKWFLRRPWQIILLIPGTCRTAYFYIISFLCR